METWRRSGGQDKNERKRKKRDDWDRLKKKMMGVSCVFILPKGEGKGRRTARDAHGRSAATADWISTWNSKRITIGLRWWRASDNLTTADLIFFCLGRKYAIEIFCYVISLLARGKKRGV